MGNPFIPSKVFLITGYYKLNKRTMSIQWNFIWRNYFYTGISSTFTRIGIAWWKFLSKNHGHQQWLCLFIADTPVTSLQKLSVYFLTSSYIMAPIETDYMKTICKHFRKNGNQSNMLYYLQVWENLNNLFNLLLKIIFIIS